MPKSIAIIGGGHGGSQVAASLRDGGYEPDPRAGKAFAELVRADSARYAEAVKRAGIEAQ